MTAFVCALLAVGLGALVGLWPRVRAWRRARRVRRSLGTPAERLTEAAVGKTTVVVGVLRASAASKGERADRRPLVATTVPPLAEPAERFVVSAQTHQRADLAMACGGEVVLVQGPQILVGSQEWRASSGGAAREAVAIAAALSLDPTSLGDGAVRVLRDGDRVVARGTACAVPATATGHHYREASAALALVPPPGGFVEVAYAGVPSVPRSRRSLGAALATTVAAWVVLLGAAHTAPRVASAVYRAMHPCPHDLEVSLAHGDPEAASRRAEECGDLMGAARGAWEAADFERASAVFLQAHAAGLAPGPSLSEVAAHLLAGRDIDSALVARALAHDQPVYRGTLECYADALDVRRGDPLARERLSSSALEGGASAMCALLAADVRSGSERIEFLETAHRPAYGAVLYAPGDMDAYAFALLYKEAGGRDITPSPPEWYALQGLRGLRYYLLERPLGLEQARRGHGAPAVETEDALTFAAFASYVGDHAEAANEYRRALAASGMLDALQERAASGLFEYWPPAQGSPYAAQYEAGRQADRRLFFLGATLALRAREVTHARILAEMAREETHGRAMLAPFFAVLAPESNAPDAERTRAFSAIASAETWEPSRQLWSLAANGNSATIPREIRAQGLDGRGVIPYLAPDAATADALRTFVADSYPPPCWTCGPHALLDWVVGRREAAQALGMSDLDAILAAEAQRLHAAFVRRDVSVPLYVLGRLAAL